MAASRKANQLASSANSLDQPANSFDFVEAPHANVQAQMEAQQFQGPAMEDTEDDEDQEG